MVSDLVTPSGAWNEVLIRQTFEDIDANAVLSTPLRGIDDHSWGWVPERHGGYSVRSAYKLLYDEQCQFADQGRASVSGDPTWKRIWKMCIPPKCSGGEW